MKAILSLCLLVASYFTPPAIDGSWKATIKSPDGDMELTFVFKTTDGKLTGEIKGPMGEMPISNGKITEKGFSFDVDAGGMLIKHDCTFKDDDTVTAKITGSPMGDTETEMKRQK